MMEFKAGFGEDTGLTPQEIAGRRIFESATFTAECEHRVGKIDHAAMYPSSMLHCHDCITNPGASAAS